MSKKIPFSGFLQFRHSQAAIRLMKPFQQSPDYAKMIPGRIDGITREGSPRQKHPFPSGVSPFASITH